MAQWVTVPATNPDDSSSICGTLTVMEGEKQLLQVVLWPHTRHDTCASPLLQVVLCLHTRHDMGKSPLN